MGTSRWSTDDWQGYSATTSAKSTAQIFTSNDLHADLDPKGTNRESRDSDENPESTAIIIGCDVTGSMGIIAENLVRKGLGVLFEEIYDRKPVSDPHIMVSAIGDVDSDRVPLQVGQFEADLTITEDLEKVFVEGNGGGNQKESYDMPMYYAAYHTSIDCFEKRGKKGYIFTIGDELPPSYTDKNAVKSIIGDDGIEANIPFKDVVMAASKMYNVYHIVIAEGWFAEHNGAEYVRDAWKEYLSENVIILSDYTKLAEVIVSVMEVNEGRDVAAVAGSWSGDTSLVVKKAIDGLPAKSDEDVTDEDVMRF